MVFIVSVMLENVGTLSLYMFDCVTQSTSQRNLSSHQIWVMARAGIILGFLWQLSAGYFNISIINIMLKGKY